MELIFILSVKNADKHYTLKLIFERGFKHGNKKFPVHVNKRG